MAGHGLELIRDARSFKLLPTSTMWLVVPAAFILQATELRAAELESARAFVSCLQQVRQKLSEAVDSHVSMIWRSLCSSYGLSAFGAVEGVDFTTLPLPSTTLSGHVHICSHVLKMVLISLTRGVNGLRTVLQV